jgi:hypothetical protein
LLLVGMAAVNDNHTTNQGWQSPTGGSLTYTQVGESTDAPFAVTLTNFSLSAAMYRADVGGSPSAHTITVDAYSGTQVAFYDVRACDITGHGSSTPVQAAANGGTIGSGGSGSDSGSGTVTLGATPTAGNLIVVYFGCAADVAAAPASPTAGGGKTFTAVSTSTGPNSNGGMWYRVADGGESATITCADLGQSIGNYGAVAVEIAAPAADSALVLLQQWPTVNLVGGPWPRIQILASPDAGVQVQVEVTTGESDLGLGAESTVKKVAVVSARCTAGIGAQSTAAKKAPTVASGWAGTGSLVTAKKKAPAVGSGLVGVGSIGTVKKAATPALNGAVGLAGVSTVRKVARPALNSAVGLAGVATGQKRATPSGNGAFGLLVLATGQKKAPATGNSAFGFTSWANRAGRAITAAGWAGIGSSSTVKKVSVPVVTGPVGLLGVNTAVTKKATGDTARGVLGLSSAAVAGKRQAVTGRAPVGAASWLVFFRVPPANDGYATVGTASAPVWAGRGSAVYGPSAGRGTAAQAASAVAGTGWATDYPGYGDAYGGSASPRPNASRGTATQGPQAGAGG